MIVATLFIHGNIMNILQCLKKKLKKKKHYLCEKWRHYILSVFLENGCILCNDLLSVVQGAKTAGH